AHYSIPFLKAFDLRCFLPLRFRDMRRISRRARRLASSSDGGSPDGGFGMGGAPPPRVSLIDSSFLTAFRASLTFFGGPGRSLNSFLATCSASFLSRMTSAAAARPIKSSKKRIFGLPEALGIALQAAHAELLRNSSKSI
ncbi:unnamed protein product, partial [Pelagomonas calceolata]